MFAVRYDLSADHGASGVLRIAGGLWRGDTCGFEFADALAGIAGTACIVILSQALNADRAPRQRT